MTVVAYTLLAKTFQAAVAMIFAVMVYPLFFPCEELSLQVVRAEASTLEPLVQATGLSIDGISEVTENCVPK